MERHIPRYITRLLLNGFHSTLYNDLALTHELGEKIVFNPELAINENAYYMLIQNHPDWNKRIEQIGITKHFALSGLANWLMKKHYKNQPTKYSSYNEMLEEAIDYIQNNKP